MPAELRQHHARLAQPPDDARLVNGWYTYTPTMLHPPELRLTRSEFTPDYDLCLRLSERYAVEHLPRPLYRYRVRRESMSHGNRLRQVRASFEAAQRAVQRRGMQRDYAFSLGLRARHVLRIKPAQGDA